MASYAFLLQVHPVQGYVPFLSCRVEHPVPKRMMKINRAWEQRNFKKILLRFIMLSQNAMFPKIVLYIAPVQANVYRNDEYKNHSSPFMDSNQEMSYGD